MRVKARIPLIRAQGTIIFSGPALSAMKFGMMRPKMEAAFSIGKR